jgi:sec-independent protein translocase protein TatA
MPFGIQPIHLIVIIVVALLVFGPQKLPEIGRGLGKAINEFREGTREMTEGFREEVTTATTAAPARLTPTPVASDAPVTPVVACPNCNVANPQGATFCNQCGSRLTPVAAESAVSA